MSAQGWYFFESNSEYLTHSDMYQVNMDCKLAEIYCLLEVLR